MIPKNIAILTPTFKHFSGIDRVVQLQAEELTSKGNNVTVIALDSSIQSDKYKIVNLGMPINPLLQRLYRLFFFLDIKKLNYYKKLKKYDIVISHFYPLNWLAFIARSKYNIKYIYHNHGINTTGLLNNNIQKIYMTLFSILTNFTLLNVDHANSVSNYLKKELKKVSGINSKVVYNKIDSKRFHKNIDSKKVRKKYNIKQDDKVLLYVGRIAPHKGVHLLIKSFNLIKKQYPNSKLIIVGKPTFDKYFNNLKNLSKDIIFTGFVPDEDLPHYYASCNLYTTASLWEGFDLPAAEAQACGKKVVAFNIGSHPEIVKNGILVKKGDTKKFAEEIINIFNETK